MRKGRPNKGVEHIESLDIPPQQKLRARLIVETLSEKKSVAAASKEMGVSPGRFAQLRTRYLLKGVEGLAPRPVGRPPRRESDETVDRNRREMEELKKKLARAEAEAAVLKDLLALGVGREEDERKKKKRVLGRQKGRRKSTKRR